MFYFGGKKFQNLDAHLNPAAKKGFLTFLKWRLTATAKPWPTGLVDDNLSTIKPTLTDKQGRITFINHATVLIEFGSIRILTDPVFSEKLGPFTWLNLKRYRKPGVLWSDLPKIDYIFVSHNHYDHLDLPTAKAIAERDGPTWIVPLGVARYLPKHLRASIHELDWWQSFQHEALTITLVPAKHWSKRGVFDTNRSLWAGAVIHAYNKNVYFAGDTGYGQQFNLLRQRLGIMNVALLPIGAYEPRWFMKDSHMNPADAVQAHLDLGALKSIAIHFGTFCLSDEGMDQPIVDLIKALDVKQVPISQFSIPKNGQDFYF